MTNTTYVFSIVNIITETERLFLYVKTHLVTCKDNLMELQYILCCHGGGEALSTKGGTTPPKCRGCEVCGELS
ncbi:hypothetical protein AQUCO_01500451v1 [Aquilegia coerulea]|uniref:Uncharacterized protein n=1 Tax=Aquilegia coerulea TaxID=218851 RepID=A0A2G5DUJ1_AQUCA|nr:hypothetical protein AQUCO_01500451v1 [Aquilegia coerulea]